MNKVIKQLQREFKKNPKKAFILGTLIAVCAWVCLPLVMPKEQKPVRRNPAIAAASLPIVATTTGVAGATVTATHSWQTLHDRLSNDPRMKSAPVPAMQTAGRNPFAVPAVEFDAEAASDELLSAAVDEPEVSPTTTASLLNDVSLELSSTLVGETSRSAVINGRVFREGADVGVAAGEPLVLAAVAPRSAMIVWKGQRRELRIVRPDGDASK